MGEIFLKNISLDGRKIDILIEDGRIGRIAPAGQTAAPPEGAEVCDCSGRTAMPGFVNMHTHAGMSIMRGVGEDMLFADWLAHIWRIEEQIDEEFVYWSAKVGCLEMIRTGTTTFNDMYWHHRAARKAASEMGLRIATGCTMMDGRDPSQTAAKTEECLRLYEEDRAEDDGYIYVPSVHAVYSVSDGLFRWAYEFARSHGHRLHLHLCETRKEVEDCKAAHGGLTPVEYLDSLGVLGPEVIAAHSLWLSPSDIETLGQRGVTCVHCVNSNAKLSSGYRFPDKELEEAGVNVCIGTDGACSSNNLDMLEAMKTSAILQKAWREDPTAMPIDSLLRMASANGARALGIDAGQIREGALADILIVNTDNSFFLSPAPFEANFVYSAHSDCIESVIAGGRFVMRGREIPGEAEILEGARKVLGKLKL